MKGLFKLKFAWAVLTFLLVGGAAAVLNFGTVKPDNFPVLSWTGWTIQDYLNQKERPNIVFLGSSLMLVPLDGVDADYLNRRVDGSQHHHSAYFEDKLESKTGLHLKTFTFALPGEMPSDAYLIVNNLLKGRNKPDMIVYGVGPRDFLDNLLPSPSATDPFKYLSRFGKIDHIAARVAPEFFQRVEYELGKVCYFWEKRSDLSQNAETLAVNVINDVLPIPSGAWPISFDDRRALLPEFHPCEVKRGQAWFRPSTPEERNNFVDNLAEYKKRYAKMKWDTYKSQMSFYADALDTANSRGIKAVVVAMPITDLNRQLLSDTSWNAYRNGVLSIAKQKGATVVDLSESKDFVRSDFGDTVHLHSGGGKKFFDAVIGQLADSQDALSCFGYQKNIANKVAPTGLTAAASAGISPSASSVGVATASASASPAVSSVETAASPTAVSAASPTAVSAASPTAVSAASPTAASAASPSAASAASPSAASAALPSAVHKKLASRGLPL